MENNDRLKNSIKLKIAISEFKKENMAMKNKKTITKTIVAVCACLVLMSGIVFAKDIEKMVKNLFSNSSDAINQAVENGYVQTLEEDYVYDKDIGVKVDNLVLDELNLNVSFKFESQKENVKLLRCNKFIVSTDTGEKIYDSDQKYVTDIKDVYTASKIDWSVAPQKNEDNTFSDSLLFTLGERSNPEKNILYFKIQSFDVTYDDDTKEEVYGEWNFDVKISDEMRQSQSIEYKLQEANEHIESCKATLHPTGLELELNLKEPLDIRAYFVENEDKTHGHMLFYYKENDEFIEPVMISGTGVTYTMSFDNISSTTKIPNTIEIYADPFESSIFLFKNES